jgi:hypothetical protein
MTIGIFKSWIKLNPFTIRGRRYRLRIGGLPEVRNGVTKRKFKKTKFSIAENSTLPSQCGSGSRKPNQCGSKRIPILVRLLSHKKLNFYMKNIFQVGNRPKNIHPNFYEGTKAFLKGRKPDLFVNFGQLPCSWIRTHIPNTDPDPRQQNECGLIRIRILQHC